MYRISDELSHYARRGIEVFDGMLNKTSAVVAAGALTVLKNQGRFTNETAFLEIGVYKGKFFSLVEYASKGTGLYLIGIDPFTLEGQSKSEILQSFSQNGLETGRIDVIEGLSTDPNSLNSLIKILNNRQLVLCHVDGSHKEQDVYNDLTMLDQFVANDGIVICDDFWNKSQLSVTTAVFRYVLSETGNLKPFLLANTKLYLARKNHLDHYRKAFAELFLINTQFVAFEEWTYKRSNSDWWHTEQKMSSYNVLLI
jgi:hypothetical protein